MNIDLYTRAGEHVATVYVPPFQVMLEIICWGARYFLNQEGMWKEVSCTYAAANDNDIDQG